MYVLSSEGTRLFWCTDVRRHFVSAKLVVDGSNDIIQLVANLYKEEESLVRTTKGDAD